MIRSTMVSSLCVLSACQQGLPLTRPDSVAGERTTAECDRVSSGDTPRDDAFVLPGDFAEHTTLADLQARFGGTNVTIVEGTDESGSRTRSVVLFPDDPVRRAYVGFHDARLLEGLASILVRDAGSRWRGKRNVHVGMSFADLREANGKPFWFSGFDSQLAGHAHDQWSPALDGDDGRLGNLDVAEDEHMYFSVELGLRDGAKRPPPGSWPVDEQVSSDDPRFPWLGDLVEVTAFSATTSLDDEWQ
jgi:hypothetical protein